MMLLWSRPNTSHTWIKTLTQENNGCTARCKIALWRGYASALNINADFGNISENYSAILLRTMRFGITIVCAKVSKRQASAFSWQEHNFCFDRLAHSLRYAWYLLYSLWTWFSNSTVQLQSLQYLLSEDRWVQFRYAIFCIFFVVCGVQFLLFALWATPTTFPVNAALVASQWQHLAKTVSLHPTTNAEHEAGQAASAVCQGITLPGFYPVWRSLLCFCLTFDQHEIILLNDCITSAYKRIIFHKAHRIFLHKARLIINIARSTNLSA